MSTYPRLQGKKGKKLREKRKKQRQKKLHIYNESAEDRDRFMDLDYENSIYLPDRLSSEESEHGSESSNHYNSPSLKKYHKVGTEAIDRFYEIIDTSPNPFALGSSTENSEEEESEEGADIPATNSNAESVSSLADSAESASSAGSEEESDEMPLPTFLLEKHSADAYGPVDLDSVNAVLEYQPKLEHKTKKVFAKAKEKGILRAFQLLINNEFIQSFSFTPIPASAPKIRNTINTFCEKFDLLMHTEKEKDWYFITVAKPLKWTKKNIKKAKRKNKNGNTIIHSTSSGSLHTKSSRSPAETVSMQKTLMEGLSTPISSDNKGSQLLKRMGWDGGSLGQQGDGIVEPIGIHIKRDNKGIGASETTRAQSSSNDNMCFVRSSDHSLA